MKNYTAVEIEEKLRRRMGFFRGLWLCLVLAGKFLVSLGPQNWNIVKITNAGRIDPLEASTRNASSEVSIAPIDPDRKLP